MKKTQISILSLFLLLSCTSNEISNHNSHFDKETGILEIEYDSIADNYPLPILEYSKIREKGYGILLNIKNALPKSKQEAILNNFRKRDINAVHVFKVNNDTIQNNTRIAIEGARFVWIFSGKETPYPLCGYLKIPLNKSIENGGIIIVGKLQSEGLKRCLETKTK